MTEHPVIACYRGLDSADAVGLGAILARALDEPLVLACAYDYEAVGFSAGAFCALPEHREQPRRDVEGAARA